MTSSLLSSMGMPWQGVAPHPPCTRPAHPTAIGADPYLSRLVRSSPSSAAE